MYGLYSKAVRYMVLPRVDKQECATEDLFCAICRYPRPRRNFLSTSPFFRRTCILPQSSVRARAGHRPCNVKPGQVHEAKLSKGLAARALSKRLRQHGPTHPGVAHSCLSTLGITLDVTFFVCMGMIESRMSSMCTPNLDRNF